MIAAGVGKAMSFVSSPGRGVGAIEHDSLPGRESVSINTLPASSPKRENKKKVTDFSILSFCPDEEVLLSFLYIFWAQFRFTPLIAF